MLLWDSSDNRVTARIGIAILSVIIIIAIVSVVAAATATRGRVRQVIEKQRTVCADEAVQGHAVLL